MVVVSRSDAVPAGESTAGHQRPVVDREPFAQPDQAAAVARRGADRRTAAVDHLHPELIVAVVEGHRDGGPVPRQTITMVIMSVVVPGLVGAAIGVLAGLALHTVVVPAMGDSAGLRLPEVITDVYRPGLLVLLGLAGVSVATVGSLLPAGWAARTRIATALRTE
jgi:hypothetical protein